MTNGNNTWPAKTHLRQFAWTGALILALVAWRLPSSENVLLRLAAGILFTMGTVWPYSVRPVFFLVYYVTFPVGWLVGRVLLAAVYFGLITPLALTFRLIGRDGLHHRLDPKAATYWQPCRKRADKKQYFQQF